MSKLSHRSAYRLIHKGVLSAVERQDLSQHLQECTECQQHAATVAYLSSNLSLGQVRQRPSPMFTAAYLRSVQRHSRRSQIMKPIYAAGGIAALILLALVGWFTMRPNIESTSTGLAPDEPVVDQIAAVPTATVGPTVTPAPTATAAPTKQPVQPGDSERKLIVNDLERSYLLHIPPGLNSQEPVPVVFAFHGYNKTPVQMQRDTEFDDVADLANFLVVYPEGVVGSWNVGEHAYGIANAQDVDEPAFIRQMLSDLGTIATIDPKRIYAVGFAQGGALAYRLACEMSDIFAAIAPVSGPLEYRSCQPSQAVSIIHVHGLADYFASYSGGGEYGSQPVEQGIDTWVKSDDCTGSAQVENPQDNITHTTYASCQAGSAIEIYTIDGGGHVWPATEAMPFTEIIWDFFATHPKP